MMIYVIPISVQYCFGHVQMQQLRELKNIFKSIKSKDKKIVTVKVSSKHTRLSKQIRSVTIWNTVAFCKVRGPVLIKQSTLNFTLVVIGSLKIVYV